MSKNSQFRSGQLSGNYALVLIYCYSIFTLNRFEGLPSASESELIDVFLEFCYLFQTPFLGFYSFGCKRSHITMFENKLPLFQYLCQNYVRCLDKSTFFPAKITSVVSYHASPDYSLERKQPVQSIWPLTLLCACVRHSWRTQVCNYTSSP